MDMYILSGQQFEQITHALEQAQIVLLASQRIELDLTKPKQTIPLPAGEKIVRTTSIQTPKSQKIGRAHV